MAKTSHWHWSNSSSMQEASGAGSQRKRDAHAPRCQKAVRQFLKDSRWRKKKYISNIQVTSRRCFNHLYFTPLSLSIRPIWQNLGSVPHKSRCKKEWKQWSTGLYDCCADPWICFFGYLALPCLFANNAEGTEGRYSAGWWDAMCLVYMCWPFTCTATRKIRTQLREKYNIEGDIDADRQIHMWCSCCAFMQEARELKARGDLKRGAKHHANVQLAPHGAPQGVQK
ncbi:PLAC8 family-domain-containing protein [Dunaliella salina]|uniref:PLAC8 family-domain-containing protein n=1 Tax=Dunaliella salina TaxID=3046 RepID=A0ABQ7H473_DUNSA|nr:PLAC8 family-domain-containing protein [Dunaliella salina]|eukprot:KAF5841662.1 PLAC8 family-domain-containing protein [Dunaliella salina]